MTVFQLPRPQLHISNLPIGEFVSHRIHKGSRLPSAPRPSSPYEKHSLNGNAALAQGRVCAGTSYPASKCGGTILRGGDEEVESVLKRNALIDGKHGYSLVARCFPSFSFPFPPRSPPFPSAILAPHHLADPLIDGLRISRFHPEGHLFAAKAMRWRGIAYPSVTLVSNPRTVRLESECAAVMRYATIKPGASTKSLGRERAQEAEGVHDSKEAFGHRLIWGPWGQEEELECS
ncbi:hypothetical protein FIBSPDRAFT_884840 [Athelia psychrophila]|uniref:Uncharacterized protein n=1 Tax=Athelia psychrophila TaxID=1759441 RepID=A0A166SFX9_9AGAM|nr:hypothetical protein FIBSPDRAFT_884840 [Fibularhizoctonia sp. CBS 109695]